MLLFGHAAMRRAFWVIGPPSEIPAQPVPDPMIRPMKSVVDVVERATPNVTLGSTRAEKVIPEPFSV